LDFRDLVPPPELLGAAGQQEQTSHAVLPQLDQPLPSELDFVLPEPAVAAFTVRRSGRGLRPAVDMEPGQAFVVGTNPLRPEYTLLEIALTTRGADRVHVELGQVGVAHEQSRQVVGEPEALGPGLGVRL